MDVGEIVRYSLYSLTVVSGLALFGWLVFSARTDHRAVDSVTRDVVPATSPMSRTEEVDPLQSPAGSLADALAGFDFPPEWQSHHLPEVTSPLTLSTEVHSEGEVANLLSDEFVRQGFRVTPTGARSARATRDDTCISIEVEPAGPDSVVTSRLTLTDSGRG